MTVALVPVLRAEWIRTRTLRGTAVSWAAVLLSTVGVTVLAMATVGRAEAVGSEDPLLFAFYGINFGQIAALCFGTLMFSSEYVNGALRISLAAVPSRGRFYTAKVLVVGVLGSAVGVLTGFAAFLVGQTFLGSHALGLGDPGVVRACVGAGLYLGLLALLAAGTAAVLRSGTAVLSLLVPFVLLVSFVVGDVATGVAPYLPDRAGQQVLHQDPSGPLGPWAGLAVTAAWAGAALVAGWWCLRRRDA
ncbi:ABC transporter permease [Streptomyces sp. TR06-5]|uniref:ABC transporter permease n=1 Tax=unclassified Streptomyces TaxID=2593676 RepID=UPI00399FCEF1